MNTPSVFAAVRAVALLAVLALGGCESLSEGECRGAPCVDVGLRDTGEIGAVVERFE